MNRNKNSSLWHFREAADIRFRDRFILMVLVAAGIISIVLFADWWFRPGHVIHWWPFLLLSLVFWYCMARIVLIWINYLRIRKPDTAPPPDPGLSVAIFTTSSPGEPLSMFEKTLEACARIKYPHTTYLLDDTRDPRFREVAERYGAVWMELLDLPGAKAGKINAALERTTEDFILVLDPDHIPFPDFLDHTLGFFRDEKTGFVQVSQAYYNQYRSFTAAGAAEQTYMFYGPTQMSLFGHGCSVAIGANCTFRRKALESIGGHGIGLAEDLITSIRIHAAGWKSVYNPVVVSRGLVPEDFGSFCKQQLKWARGVFEVTFAELPRLHKKLTFWQKLSYLVIGTYYLSGAIQFFFLLLPFLFFFTGILPASISFAEFLIRGLPILLCAVGIYLYMQRWLCHPASERGLHWRGTVLKFSCWPVFFWGFLLAIINADIPYIPTAKKAVTRYFTPFARPLLVHIILFVVSVTVLLIYRRFWMPESRIMFTAEETWSMIGFAFIAFIMSVRGIFAAFESWRMREEEPWAGVQLNCIKTKKDEDNHI